MLKQRSSWPSSFVTGLIGWNGFLIIVDLALGYQTAPATLFLAGTLAAVLQVVILRLAFFALRLQRGLLYGALWGVVSAGILFLAESPLFPALKPHFLAWFLTAIYVGPAVGAFLSYFYRDDRAIEAETPSGQPVDYGRDAHWLEPFAFGALAYLLVFLPRNLDLALSVLVVGAMSGVFAAGASHFVLFSRLRKSGIPFVIGLLGGAVQGAISGLLFRHYVEALYAAPWLIGAGAGVLTYLMTTLRGSQLARQEAADEPIVTAARA